MKVLDLSTALIGVPIVLVWLLLGFLLRMMIVEGAPGSGEARYSRGWTLLWTYGLTTVLCGLIGLLLYQLPAEGGLPVFLLMVGGAVGGLYRFGEGTGTPTTLAMAAAMILGLTAAVAGAASSGFWLALRLPLLVIAGACSLVGAIGWITRLSRARAQAQDEDWTRRFRQDNLEKKMQDMVGINQRVLARVDENQPLSTLLPLFEGASGVSGELVGTFKKLKRRQADIEEMLAHPERGDENIALQLVAPLELEATPRLVDLLNAWCCRAAEQTKPGGRDESGTYIFFALDGLKWVHRQGGDLKEGVTRLQAAAEEGMGPQHRDPGQREQLLKELAEMLR